MIHDPCEEMEPIVLPRLGRCQAGTKNGKGGRCNNRIVRVPGRLSYCHLHKKLPDPERYMCRHHEVGGGFEVGDTVTMRFPDHEQFTTKYVVRSLRWKPENYDGDGQPHRHTIQLEEWKP